MGVASCFLLVLLAVLSRTCLGGRDSTEMLFLTAHNKARAGVGVEPLAWSTKLSDDAARYAKQHRRKKGCEYPSGELSGPYGENQAWASDPISPTAVVGLWVEDKPYYDHATNTCIGGHNCNMYTQVVWRNSTKLGCAQVQCGRSKASTLNICYYFPRGNIPGQSPY